MLQCDWFRWIQTNNVSILSPLSRFCFWVHKHLSDWSISKRYLKSKAAPWVEWKEFNIKSISHSWYVILLLIWKRCARAFHCWALALSLNGSAAAHQSALKNHLTICMNLTYGCIIPVSIIAVNQSRGSRCTTLGSKIIVEFCSCI